jgi:hypothetical protein
MPSIASRAKELEMRFLKYAPKGNQDKIKTVLDIYKDRKNVNYTTALNIIMALSSPSSQGGMEKVQKMYELFLNKHQSAEQYPSDAIRTMRYIDRMRERRDRLLGVKKQNQVRGSVDGAGEHEPQPRKLRSGRAGEQEHKETD